MTKRKFPDTYPQSLGTQENAQLTASHYGFPELLDAGDIGRSYSFPRPDRVTFALFRLVKGFLFRRQP